MSKFYLKWGWVFLFGAVLTAIPVFRDSGPYAAAVSAGVVTSLLFGLPLLIWVIWRLLRTVLPSQKSVGVKAVYVCLQSIQASLGEHIQASSMIAKAEQAIKANQTGAKDSVDQVGAEVVAWVAIRNACFEYILNENPFIYRGVLSTSGKDALSIWSKANKKLVELGNISKDEGAADKIEILEHIQKSG